MELTKEKLQAGSNLTPDVVQAKPADSNGQVSKQDAGASSLAMFSTYYTWRGNGTVKLNCGNPSIKANSRVVAAVSEYNTDPTLNRFIGNATMNIANVSPYNGGVVIRVNVNWSGPINVRVDVFVDP